MSRLRGKKETNSQILVRISTGSLEKVIVGRVFLWMLMRKMMVESLKRGELEVI